MSECWRQGYFCRVCSKGALALFDLFFSKVPFPFPVVSSARRLSFLSRAPLLGNIHNFRSSQCYRELTDDGRSTLLPFSRANMDMERMSLSGG